MCSCFTSKLDKITIHQRNNPKILNNSKVLCKLSVIVKRRKGLVPVPYARKTIVSLSLEEASVPIEPRRPFTYTRSVKRVL